MRTQLFFTLSLLFGAFCTAQELVGPDRVPLGTLVSFKITPAQEASWHIVTPSSSVGSYQVDTSLSKLYLASPTAGHYTVVAGIVKDGKPEILVKTFFNGDGDDMPSPPVSSLEAWIKAQLPELVKSSNLTSESRLVANCFDEIAQRIDDGNIKTVQNAQAQLKIALTGTLALASPTAVTDWTPFLTELSKRLEEELGDKIDDLATVKTVLHDVARGGLVNAMKSFERGDPMLRTTLRGIDTPKPDQGNIRTQGTQNRVFRGLR